MDSERNKKLNLMGGKIHNFIGAVLVIFCFLAGFTSQAAAQSSYSLAQYQTPIKNQEGRDSCWAFAGVAALEAAYNRKYGIELDLSEQYAFHMGKAMELQPRVPDNNTSLMGFQGASDFVSLLSRIAIPEEKFAPYLSDSEMKQLQAKLKVGDIINNPSATGFDTFEFSEEHIPMASRWNARYRVSDYGWVLNPKSTLLLEQTLLENREIVIDLSLYWKLNPQTNVYEFDPTILKADSHVLLLIGYDRDAQVFIAKNSWGESDFIRLSYDLVRKHIGGAYYIKDVADPLTLQKRARYLGFWDFDHLHNNQRLKGRLVIRRFTDFHQPDGNQPIKLGSLYPDNGGSPLEVTGYFTEDGEGIVLDIGSRHITYPLGFWRVVDNNYTGAIERGTLEQPFRNFAAAADSIQSGGVLIVQPGSYAAVRAYNKAMTIRPLYGSITLGNGN